MNFLLDVDVLVAWGWSDHVAHERTSRWLARIRDEGESRLLTSAIPQLGFVRVSVQRTAGAVTGSDAAGVLRGMLESLHEIHLVVLAENQAQLSTLDESIPGAFVIPALKLEG